MVERLAYKPGELADALSCSRAKVYDLIASGELATMMVGKDQRVTVASVKAWIGKQQGLMEGSPMSETLTPARQVTADELALVKNTVAAGATDAELKLFLFDCQRQGVHPLDRLLHFTKRSNKYTPVTSIDFMRLRAADTGEMAGSDDPVFTGGSSERHPGAAMVTVYRLTQGQRFGYTATARWDEYYPGEGAPGFMWRKMPYVMLGKCAEALALRKGFPRQLAGLYAKEELDQADAVTPPVTPTVVEAKPIPSGELPAGARRVTLIGPGKAGAVAEVTFENGETFLTWRKPVATVAQQFLDAQTPCLPTFITSASGNRRLEALVAWRADLELVPDDIHIPPPFLDEAF